MLTANKNPDGANVGAENIKSLGGDFDNKTLSPKSGQNQRRCNEDKRSALTQRNLKSILKYDPQTGHWTWLKDRGRFYCAGKRAGTPSNGYNQIEIDGVLYRGARLAFLYMTGQFPPVGLFADHISGVRNDDRWSNLRLATPSQNAQNRGPCARNKSGKVGVHFLPDRQKWEAEICVEKRAIKLGCFECKDDAVTARCEAEKHHFGDFARRLKDARGSA